MKILNLVINKIRMTNSQRTNKSVFENSDTNKQEGASLSLVVALVATVRVVIILVVWLMMFLGMFVGYFTVPIILIGVLVLIYSIFDIGLAVYVRRSEKSRIDQEIRNSN